MDTDGDDQCRCFDAHGYTVKDVRADTGQGRTSEVLLVFSLPISGGIYAVTLGLVDFKTRTGGPQRGRVPLVGLQR